MMLFDHQMLLPDLPPAHFVSVKPPIKWCRPHPPLTAHLTGGTNAQIYGKTFEGKVIKRLQKWFPSGTPHWSMEFEDSRGRRKCEMDFVTVSKDDRIMTIFEIKVRHIRESWWQLRRLYAPVLHRFYPYAHINVCEIVGSFDPDNLWPEEFEWVESIIAWPWTVHTKPGVYRLRKDGPSAQAVC